MQGKLTANRVSSIATGIFVFAGFGTGWLFWGLAIRQQINGATASAAGFGMLALMAAAIYIRRQAKRWPRAASDSSVLHAFVWINVLEWAAVFAAGYVCPRFGWADYFPTVVTLIGGLHFYPLARVFRNPLHYGTGTALVVWALAAAAFLPADRLQGITTLGTGALLWAAALVTIARAMSIMRANQTATVQA